MPLLHLLFPSIALRQQVALLTVQLEAANRAHAEAETWRAYWQRRAEKFLDAASAHAGLTHGPTMRELPPVTNTGWLHQGPLKGLGITEIAKRDDEKQAS
jgi:hypothetical protein